MGPHDRPDPEFEAILADGTTDDGTELARLVAALRSDVRPPAAEDAHVAAMVEAGAHRQVSMLPERRRNEMPNRRAILLKVLVPAFALLMLFSGMAFAGVLPGPLQGAVDHWVGNDDDQGIAPALDDDQGEDGDDQGEDEGNAVSDDDQGEDGDHQGEDGDDQGGGGHDGGDQDDDDQGGPGHDHQGDDDDQGAGGHDGGDQDDQGGGDQQ